MATMFNPKTESANGGVNETIIGEAVKLDGTFSGSANVTVYGEIVGTLTTTGDLVVADTAVIEAEVEAHNISIAGEVRGDITANGKLELLASAKIIGNVTAEVLSVETGAVLQGTCTTGHSGRAAENTTTQANNESEEA